MKRSPMPRRSAPLKSTAAKAPTGLRKVSVRKAEERDRLHRVYDELARTRPRVCAGCGRAQGGLIKLSHSHLVPRSYNQALICEPDNIAYHCLDWLGHVGCHGKHESNTERHTLLDFRANIAYIKQADPDYFRLLALHTYLPQGYERNPFN